ncbi:MAG: trypsin-like peptidase domain-containing protein [Planctomycetota bacterium]
MNKSALPIAIAAIACSSAIAQVGRNHANAQKLANVQAVSVPELDRPTIAAIDTARAANGQPARYAIPNDVSWSPDTHGTWEVLDGTWSLWRLRIKAPGAYHVNLGFDDFSLPGNARVQLYSSDYAHVMRPLDANDQQPSGELWTPIVRGSEITCELYVQTAQRAQAKLNIMHAGSGYRFFGFGATALGGTAADGSGSCNIDVACSQAVGWENEISAVAAISTGGSIFCSGCMVNNTAQDGRDFFLTANHCGVNAGSASSLVCYWNYDSANCGSGNAPLNQFTLGSTFRARWSTSDFSLVELNSTPNAAWGVTYAGWNRGSGTAPSSVAIHHPSGDAKKISFENQSTQITDYLSNNTSSNGTHQRVVDWDLGTTEGGSSGSPLFDQNHRIIGQLHGGYAACGNNDSDWYGRVFRSWTGGGSNSTRLSNWLDPLGTGQQTLDTLAGGDVANAIAYGVGCYASYPSFAEEFVGGGFDMSGSNSSTVTIRMTRTGSGYDVDFGANTWFTPQSGNLNLADDDLYQVTLPWSISHGSGQTQVVQFCSNGFVWLNGSSTSTDYSPTSGELLSEAARLAPLWMDLDPTSGGSCHYDVGAGVVYFTWLGLPPYGASGSNTFQVALFQNGSVEYRYRAIGNQPDEAVVGYGASLGSSPPAYDLNNDLPIATGPISSPLVWTGSNRPVLGTTQQLQLSNIPTPQSSIGVVVIGWTAIPGGLDLGFLGAGGCRLYTQSSVIDTMAFPVLGATHGYSLAIPSTPSLSGQSIYTQGAVLEPPSANALGARTSNGVELKLGTL